MKNVCEPFQACTTGPQGYFFILSERQYFWELVRVHKKAKHDPASIEKGRWDMWDVHVYVRRFKLTSKSGG